MCLSQEKVDLGVRDLKAFNRAFVWQIAFEIKNKVEWSLA